MSPPFPRLLVVTEFPPNASGGGPAVVRQMLRDWPADRLCWWSALAEQDARFGQCVAAHACVPIPPRLMPHRRLARLKSRLLETLWVPRASAHLRRTVRAQQPDVIWVIPHQWAVPPLHAALLGEKPRFHVTFQDYADTPGNVLRLGPARCTRFAKMADQLYAAATTRDATSHPMIADLQSRTGAAAAQMLHAGVEAEDFAFLENGCAPAGDEIRIAYAGTILVEAEFALFSEALEKARAGLTRKVSLHLFGTHSYASRPWFRPAWMQEHGNLTEPQLLAALRDCTFGFSPMALKDQHPRYNRFSFPTKFISYLAAGLPVISLGHPESSLAKMAAGYDVGPVITGGTAAEISTILLPALAREQPWLQYRREILRCARTEFDATAMRHTLYSCLGGPASALL